MSIEDNLRGLDAAMAEADGRAEAVRASYAGSVGAEIGAAELEDVARGARLVDRFLSDVDEALKQIFVAGLAYPDPELPDELNALAERASRHGLASAVAHLSRLAVLVEAISAQRDLLVRHDFAQRAWDETQRFVAWLRMFRVEHDHLVVQGKLAAQSVGAVEHRRVTYPARTMSVWPVGMELDAGGRLVIFARDLDSRLVVLLRDHLADFDPESPLTSRAISRLFQDSIVLGDVLRNVIRLEDHPVVTRARALLVRPAFQAIPKLRPVGDRFTAPALPTMPLSPSGAPAPIVSDGPARLSLRARLDGGALVVETLAGARVPLSLSTQTLRHNLTKLMIREAAACVELDAVLLPRDEELLILNVTTPLEGVTFPAYDPSLFKIANTVLARAADATAEALTHAPIKAAWLRCAAYLPGGVTPEQVDDLLGQLAGLKASALSDHYLLELSRYFVGGEGEPEGLEHTLRRTLQLAALPEGASVDLGALAHVLGLPERATSPVDLRLIDGDAIYKAVWMAFERDLIESLEVELDAVYKARYAGELKNPTPGDVCARALMMAIFERLVQDEDVAAEARPSTQFLRAFINDLNPGGARAKKTPMPEPLEIFWYGDTLAVLTAGDRLGSPVSKLGLSREVITRACVDALHAWRTSEAASLAVIERAAEAILLAVSSDVKGVILT